MKSEFITIFFLWPTLANLGDQYSKFDKLLEIFYYEIKSKSILGAGVDKEWHEDGNFAESAVFTSHILVKMILSKEN